MKLDTKYYQFIHKNSPQNQQGKSFSAYNIYIESETHVFTLVNDSTVHWIRDTFKNMERLAHMQTAPVSSQFLLPFMMHHQVVVNLHDKPIC